MSYKSRCAAPLTPLSYMRGTRICFSQPLHVTRWIDLSNELQLQQIQPKPALLYPLILEERLELILVIALFS